MDKHNKLMSANYKKPQASADSRFLPAGHSPGADDFFVRVEWLKEQIDKGNEHLVIIDVTRGEGNYPLDATRLAEDYEKGHIPGAVHLNTDELGEFKDYFNSPSEMRDVFLSKGITRNSLVVFYSIYARDILYIASRMAFAAYYLGVDQVKILDGGLQAWQRAGYPIEKGATHPRPAVEFGINVPARPEIYVKTPQDLILLKKENPELLLTSVRTWNEFLGVNEGHHWNKGAGEIAGAVYAGDELLANELGELAHPSVYLAEWEKWGIHPDKNTLLYCGTSWRSSTAFFVMKSLGWENIKMFDGSWYKYYLAHQENPAEFPIQRGNPLGEPAVEFINH